MYEYRVREMGDVEGKRDRLYYGRAKSPQTIGDKLRKQFPFTEFRVMFEGYGKRKKGW